ncbi:MAG: hypothetical protein IPP82_13180 [Xanthomonadales bacterium]|nr:hypothetical protein [Xanthomonadales bacterium]
MNIQKRASWLTLLLIAVVSAAGVAATVWQDREISRLIDTHDLRSTQSIQQFAEDSRRRELELKTSILASNPGFVGYISQAMTAGLESGGAIDAASIRDLLEERRNQYSFDVAAILDPSGKTVVMLGNTLLTMQDFSSMPVFAKVRASSSAVIDLIHYKGHLILVSLSPMLRGDTLEALLLTGIDVADGFAGPIARAGSADIALIGVSPGGKSVVTSTLGAEDYQALIDAVAAEPTLFAGAGTPMAPGDFDLLLAGGATRASVSPLFNAPSSGLLVSIVPVAERVVRSGAIRTPMLIAGALVLIVLGLLWWIVQRGLVRPASHLTEMSERVLRGDIQVVARDIGSGDLSIMAKALNHALKELRGYKEVVEQREKQT